MSLDLRPTGTTADTVDISDISQPMAIRWRALTGVVVGAAVVGMWSAASSFAAGDTWTIKDTMPTARYSFAAATGPDGKIYAIGPWVPAWARHRPYTGASRDTEEDRQVARSAPRWQPARGSAH